MSKSQTTAPLPESPVPVSIDPHDTAGTEMSRLTWPAK
jgi:hypothetical protein